MAAGTPPLGKGLDALLPADLAEEDERSTSEYFQCPIFKIEPNPYQPRQHMDEQRLRELAESIRTKGVIQPLVVRQAEDNGGYELIAGERRLRAARIAGLEMVPVVLREATPEDRLELALIENIQRQNLNPVEEAAAYQQLAAEFSLTQEEIAVKVGKERSTVTNILRLLQLPDFAQQDIRDGILTMGHGRVLLSLKENNQILELRNIIVAKSLSVRQSEQLAKKLKKAGKPPKKRTARNPISESYCQTLNNEIVSYLGNKSRIIQQGDRGKIEIEYYSFDDLERLHKLILSKDIGE